MQVVRRQAMTYSLFIERENRPISLAEWKHAVEAIDGVRLHSGGIEATNPNTGEVISIKGQEGDVGVNFQSQGLLEIGTKSEWIPAIHFHEGRGTFKATPDIENPANPVHAAAVRLAKALEASIRGEEGEVYEW